jgi:hypothetical protein
VLEEASTDRAGGLHQAEFHKLIHKMRVMENRPAAAPVYRPSGPTPAQEMLVFPQQAPMAVHPAHGAPMPATLLTVGAGGETLHGQG